MTLFRFRIDQNYVGEPPAIEITVTNLNDNIDKQFLTDLLQKCGATEDVIIYYHPLTKRHLGLARIVFVDVKSARNCIDKYNGTSVMGKELNVFHDAFGEQCKRILEEITSEKKPSLPSVPSSSSSSSAAVAAATASASIVVSMPPFNEDPLVHPLEPVVPFRAHGKSDTDDSWGNLDATGRKWDKDRKWEKERKHHHYHHKSEKERDRRPEREYRSHREHRPHERDRERDRDRDRDRERDRDRGREYSKRDYRRDRGSSRESKYRDSYKKSDRDYLPPSDAYSSSYNGVPSTHSTFDSSTYHHAYPPPMPPQQPYVYSSTSSWQHGHDAWSNSSTPSTLPPSLTEAWATQTKHIPSAVEPVATVEWDVETDSRSSKHKSKDKKEKERVCETKPPIAIDAPKVVIGSSSGAAAAIEEDDQATIDLDTRIAMMFKEKSFGAAPFLHLDDSESDGERDEKPSTGIAEAMSLAAVKEEPMVDSMENSTASMGDVRPSAVDVDVGKVKIKKENNKSCIEDGASDISSDDELLLKVASPGRTTNSGSIKLEDDKMSLSSLSSTDDKNSLQPQPPLPATIHVEELPPPPDYMYPQGTNPYYYSNGTASSTYDPYKPPYMSQSSYMQPFVAGFSALIPGGYVPSEYPSRRSSESKSSLTQPKQDPNELLVSSVIERVTNELKQILKKDFNKRMIESIAYKKFEAWWDEQQRNKTKVVPTAAVAASNATNIPPTVVAAAAVATIAAKETPASEKTSKAPDINQVLNNNRDSYENYNGYALGLRPQFMKLPRFQRIRKPPSPVRQDEDSKKNLSDQEDMVQGSDSEHEVDVPASKVTFSEKLKEDDAKMRKHKAGSVSSFFTSSSEEESSSQSESESESSSLSEVDDIIVPTTSKPKDYIKKIYSDSDSDDEIKVIPKNKSAIGAKSKLRLYSDTLSEDEEIDMKANVVSNEPDEVEKAKTPDLAIDVEDISEGLPRTPGRESPMKSSAVAPSSASSTALATTPAAPAMAAAKTTSYDYDRLYSDSDEERDYQERRRRNTEYMEEMEREYMAEQMMEREKGSTMLGFGETTEEDDDALPEKAPSPGDPMTPILSKLPPTPGAKIIADPMPKTVAAKSHAIQDTTIAVPKQQPERDREANGYSAQTAPPSMGRLADDEISDVKLSPASSDGGSSQASQVAIDHCYSLPPTASPSLASPTPNTINTLPPTGHTESARTAPSSDSFAHDHGYTSNTSTTTPVAQPAQIPITTIQPISKPGPGRPRKDSQQAAATAATKKAKKAKANQVEALPVPQKQEIVPFVPQPKYKPREFNDSFNLLFDFLAKGIDVEDIGYLKRSYEFLLRDDKNSNWLNSTHWVDHCATDRSLIPPPCKKRRKDDDLKRHASGCARAEGYYKVDIQDKMKFKYHHTKGNESAISDVIKSKMVSKMQGASREARSNQRRLLTAFGASTESELLKFNQLKFRKKQLKFAKSAIHDWGLFAMEPIAADEMVIEYVGQMIRPVVADLRETKYEAIGIGSSYLFRIDVETIIDATKCGNLARFINHSCNVSSLISLSLIWAHSTYVCFLSFCSRTVMPK